jgi:SSS family solute:Na+ symporter
MFGLLIIDLIVIVLYFAMMIAIGVWSSRRIKNQEDFFLAGRRLGKVVQAFAAFGMGTSAETAVSVSTTTFTNGASGVWSSLLYLFGTPVYWLISPWQRRVRLLTTGDFFLERYGCTRMAAP